jgi:hypothetical protein
MSDRNQQQPQIDPGVQRIYERERKLAHYDDLRVHRAGLAGAMLMLFAVAVWEVLRR